MRSVKPKCLLLTINRQLHARRNMSVTDYSGLSKVAPEKSLLGSLEEKFRPQQLRQNHRPSSAAAAIAENTASSISSARKSICRQPCSRPWSTIRTVRLSSRLIQYEDGEKRYIIAPHGLKVGDMVVSGASAPTSSPATRCRLPISRPVPLSTTLSCIPARAHSWHVQLATWRS